MLEWNDWQHMAAVIRQAAARHRHRRTRPEEDPTFADLLAQRLENIEVEATRNRLNKEIGRRRRCLKRWLAVTLSRIHI